MAGPIELALPFKVFFWGIVVSSILFGVAILQAWTYLQFNRDKWHTRLFVAVLILADLAALLLISSLGYSYFVANFGHPGALQELPVFATAEPLIVAFVILAIQLFFASRVHVLRQDGWLGPALVALPALGSFIVGTFLFADITRNRFITEFMTPYRQRLVLAHNILGATSDIATTVFLSLWTWSESRSSFNFTSTQLVMRSLMRYIVTRGFLVSGTQIVTCIVYLARPDDLLWTPLHFCMARVYIITMLSMLNLRSSAERQGSAAALYKEESVSSGMRLATVREVAEASDLHMC